MEDIRRKHVEQFSSCELVAISSILKNIRSIPFEDVKFTWHTRNRINEKHLSLDEVSSSFYYGYVFEIKQHADGDVRLVIRHDDYRKKRANCIVYSIRRSEVVTAWSNNVFDRHDTIDWSAYDQDMDIIKLLESLTVQVLT
jgi:hypothetical protein